MRRKIPKIIGDRPDELIDVDAHGSQSANRLVADRTTELFLEATLAHMAAVANAGAVERAAEFGLDGLQMLALSYAKKVAHQPFFTPMFAALRKVEDPQELIVPMRQWLDSTAVNQRTDDDKTLILATRVMANAEQAV